jgi:hypothetical protein
MRKFETTKYLFFILTFNVLIFSRCATIVGGSRYIAHVTVLDHPNATIMFNNAIKGKGEATFKVKRKDANKFQLTIKEEGCQQQVDSFTNRKFRGGALVGDLGLGVAVYVLAVGIPIDFIDGAFWKPDASEKEIKKEDYKTFNYLINYSGCNVKQ